MAVLTAPKINVNDIQNNLEGICMCGRIYSDQKCPIYDGKYIHDDRRRGFSVRLTRSNSQQAAFVFSLEEKHGGGFHFIKGLKDFLTALGGKLTREHMIQGIIGLIIL
jgi:hypothetical protein